MDRRTRSGDDVTRETLEELGGGPSRLKEMGRKATFGDWGATGNVFTINVGRLEFLANTERPGDMKQAMEIIAGLQRAKEEGRIKAYLL